MNKYTLVIALILNWTLPTMAINKETKKGVQKAMKEFVNEINTANGYLPVLYKGKILKLTLKTSKKYPDGFHSGVAHKGKLFASCADFVDTSGNKYDIDFLVSQSGDSYRVMQPVVHSVNGKKNPYDLKH